MEILGKFRTIKCWFTLYLHLSILRLCKFKYFAFLPKLSSVLNCVDICNEAIKNIRNMDAVLTNVLTNETADILRFNSK